MKVQVCLTPAEQKRLVGKAVANMELVQRAYREGTIGFALCTTNAYILQELTGRKIKPEKYACGLIIPRGTCITDAKYQSPEIVIIKGKTRELNFPEENLIDYVEEMGPNDIIIKSGNALDCEGNAATLIGEFNGGEIGKIYPWIMSKGIKLIVPMTLDKLISTSIKECIKECSILEISRSMGLKVSLFPLPGMVVTTIKAVEMLSGASAIPIGGGGVGGGQGSVVMLIKGSEKQVMKAWAIIEDIKGEPDIYPQPLNCLDCGRLPKPKPPYRRTFAPFICNWRGRKSEELPSYVRRQKRVPSFSPV